MYRAQDVLSVHLDVSRHSKIAWLHDLDRRGSGFVKASREGWGDLP